MRGFFRLRSLRRLSRRRKARRCPSRATITSTARTRSAGNGRRAGARVRIESPVGYLSENPNPRETSVSTFVFWVYAPKALDGKLRFEFRKEGRTCAWFDYGLEFTGWRGAWVAFDRDMQGRPEEGMDELVVTAEGVERGELYFDHLILSSFQDVRHHTADFQAPFINAATTSHWLTLLQSWRNPMPALPAAVGEGSGAIWRPSNGVCANCCSKAGSRWR